MNPGELQKAIAEKLTGVIDPEKGRKSFSEKVLQLIESKENMGCIENADARGYFRGRCGDSMQIDLRLVGTMIIEARFVTDGCGATIACGSMVTQLARSKSLTQAMQITPGDILSALGGLPKEHEHCAELAVMTLREAVIDATDGQFA